MFLIKRKFLYQYYKKGKLLIVRDESLNLLCVRFLQRISVLERVIGMKDGGMESVGEVWELMCLSNVLGESVLMKEELFPPEF